MNLVRRLVPVLSFAVMALLGTACACENGKCFKEQSCKPCGNPCCPKIVQGKAPEAETHALPAVQILPAQPAGPTVYSYEGKVYVLFTEKGLAEFRKDPEGFEEKATRTMKGGVIYRTDLSFSELVDLAPYAANARPFVK